MPEGWVAREMDGQARVQIRRAGVGVMWLLTTDDDPSAWSVKGELFHGQLYGRYHEYASKGPDILVRSWTLLCGNVTLYIWYRREGSACEVERAEVDGMVQSLLPKNLERPLPALFGS